MANNVHLLVTLKTWKHLWLRLPFRFHPFTCSQLLSFFFLRCLILQCETHPDLCESYAEDEKLQMKKWSVVGRQVLAVLPRSPLLELTHFHIGMRSQPHLPALPLLSLTCLPFFSTAPSLSTCPGRDKRAVQRSRGANRWLIWVNLCYSSKGFWG